MDSNCPKCERSLPGDTAASFCMYCGARLEDTRIRGLAHLGDSSSVPSPTLVLEPASDPNATADYRTLSTQPERPPDEPEPERIGSYRLIRRLGVGGMGQVFEAESDDSGNRVALKLLSPKLVTNPISVERFKQEGRLASQIAHPRCVFVYGVDTDNGRPFIVMELMPGSTLKDLVDKRGPMEWDTAIHRILDVLDGLIEAHRLGMLHRDIKPSNCFLTDDDRVKIGDFGLSKSLDNQHNQKQLTSSGAFLGTVLFASPEQIRGEEVGYDSDVYSVAATLYYLLVGRAPHQHVSMTAALAKVISEPPPSIRSLRPEVPRALERIVFRGLERDRNRRYGTLEEFRDALQDVLPERQLPSRMRTLVSAYVLDAAFCLIFLTAPFVLIFDAFIGRTSATDNLNGDFLYLATLIGYFSIAEGFFGATLGKLPFRLRTVRLGRVGPVGWRAAFARALVFHSILLIVVMATGAVLRIPAVGAILAAIGLPAATIALFLQRRRSPTQQGIHDYASGCRVVQRPRAEHRPRLQSLFANPLDRAALRPNLPASVGGFRVKGVLGDESDGSTVWAAEDEALNRRILLWLRPAHLLPDGVPAPPLRPGRLRAIGTGELVWNDRAYGWVAYVAPTGAPLVDTATPEQPLEWADARSILEQVVSELRESESDGTLPGRLGADQFWIEPNGRVHLLEFPLAPMRTAVPPAETSIELVRQIAAIALRGDLVAEGIRAPIPPHASRILDRLYDLEPPSLTSLEEQLRASRAYPPAVSAGMRAAHIGLIVAFSGLGLAMLVFSALGFSVLLAINAAGNRHRSAAILEGLESPVQVETWRGQSAILRTELAGAKIGEWRERFRAMERSDQAEFEEAVEVLSRPERSVAGALHGLEESSEDVLGSSSMVELMERQALLNQIRVMVPSIRNEREYHSLATQFTILDIGVVLGFAAFAFAFRGGVSFVLSGIALVRDDGRPASRWRCAGRELLMWLPLLVLVLATIWAQSTHPGWMIVRMTLDFAIVLVLVGYLVVGLRYTNRAPHDQIVGTSMVPL
jgi:eukaryotic-like serine/threonine-protein kinase